MYWHCEIVEAHPALDRMGLHDRLGITANGGLISGMARTGPSRWLRQDNQGGNNICLGILQILHGRLSIGGGSLHPINKVPKEYALGHPRTCLRLFLQEFQSLGPANIIPFIVVFIIQKNTDDSSTWGSAKPSTTFTENYPHPPQGPTPIRPDKPTPFKPPNNKRLK